ncbi:hypothetical protein Caci_1608 [Catenulispora acidiphila DSM 44928]|uniref:Uncharacterized protein n=1 Tax=Catenulispora acidiphila (strain DSM 44928 / JCM 14897 / NBRC 102108 / NRRL B-24433 / ID139908) TaxID=479433 RepID=C7QBF2_CATAD|nr:hypothetical protein [Catenulispora acidiphila]ACU70529.1 hypothetical protein Caci_1608 [Catenulispora acidiphila DSM 44928]
MAQTCGWGLYGSPRDLLQVSEAEIVAAFGHDKPTRAEFERLSDATYSPLLEDDGRGRGRCLVLFQGGVPEAVVFWGHSGD